MLQYLDDLRVDLTRFFPQLPVARDLLVDLDVLPSRTFFTLATRLASYGGVLAARMTAMGVEAAQPPQSIALEESAGVAAPRTQVTPTPPAPAAAPNAQQSGQLDANGIRLPKDPKGGEVRVVPLSQLAMENPDLIGRTKVG